MRVLRGLAACCAVLAAIGHAAELKVTAVNRLPFVRSAQTIELTAAQLAPLGVKDLATVHVRNAEGRELLVQAVDTDFDAYRKPDIVIFQADFRANETLAFTVSEGARQVYAKEQFKAFGRFVRERFDDFAWENDRIAHRTYGRALETWDGEPLASSTIDVWSKRTPRMVINDWYLADHYHQDAGEGADFYSAGLSRGCGGNGLWAAGRLWTSRNFVDSRVLASGPIRVMFELEYAPFEVDGVSVSEVKRVTLDAGSQLDHFRSTYKTFTRPGRERALTTAIGLKKVEGEQVEFDADRGWLLKWEKVEQGAGEQGLAIVSAAGPLGPRADDKLNHLVLAPVPASGAATYWAGFAWNRAGHVTDAAAWKKYVDEFAQGTRSPIEVSVSAAPR
ncbi:DUF4861 family protein [Usitatibacter palustris]|uniref:DUF4861 domain-containing protein n=1 Tax=Usitatibacter palustris TaxID=2732487 RepID=A0A6M4H4F9_9PROT|nr:DUF4861 family protein [Usitatibacter palustris]QJR14499.1 hypothetical protein DSM104440_01300 [Usitatibacter palustris]